MHQSWHTRYLASTGQDERKQRVGADQLRGRRCVRGSQPGGQYHDLRTRDLVAEPVGRHHLRDLDQFFYSGGGVCSKPWRGNGYDLLAERDEVAAYRRTDEARRAHHHPSHRRTLRARGRAGASW